ncbi:unnamed protein product [Brachionus calyciflorus]|uniref:Uncharacterized protein n=1 Tax=Brachionus calyciflorus TaxID=104777 RepID=A0A814B951_9BILA|nr:unnamed protein product [Brachionus calyciflorus]
MHSIYGPDSLEDDIDDLIRRRTNEEDLKELEYELTEVLKDMCSYGYEVHCFDEFINLEKISFFVNDIKNELKSRFPRFKIIVNVTMGESLDQTFSMAVETFIDNKNDIYAHYAFQDDLNHFIASVFLISY